MLNTRILFAILLTLSVSGCGGGAITPPIPTPPPVITVPAAATPTVTRTPTVYTDSANRKVSIVGVPQRLISLAPSNTEILFALDLGKQVVGVDAFSDFPSEAKSLTQIGGSGNQFNFEQIVALKPDLVLAASTTPADAIKKLEDLKIAVAVIGTATTTFEGIAANIALVGQMTGKSDKAKSVTDAMKQKIDSIKAKAATAKTKPRVYWELDGTDPAKPFSVGPGNFVNDIISAAGGTNIFAKLTNPFPQVSSENVVAGNPEIIIMSDAAYGVTVDSLLKRKGWQVILAVKNKNVHPIDDNLVSRPTERVADGLEAAAKLIHPELFK